MAKQPTFKLYRICNRENGKAFCAFGCSRRPYYTQQGAFFRQPETIRRHLKALCWNWEYKSHTNGKYGGYFARTTEKPDEHKKFYVECYAVLQLSMCVKEASEYLGIKK